MDVVDLEHVFEFRALVMKSVPKFMRGAFRGAWKISLEAIRKGHSAGNEEVACGVWKLFMLLPRMLLSRPPRGGLIPRQRLEERLGTFNAGEWVQLLESSMEAAMLGPQANSRKRRRGRNNDAENRVARALQLTHMGELFSARQALEASPVAPGNESTRSQVDGENRRPSRPRRSLDADHNFRTVRRGAVGGLSGMNGGHLKTVLESPSCLGLFSEVAAQFARAEIPEEHLKANVWAG